MIPFLQVDREGAVVVLTMNQPSTRNALNGTTVVDEFAQALASAGADPSVRAIVLTAQGTVFCSGGNLKDMQRYASGEVPMDVIKDEYRHGIQRLPRMFEALDVPVIAAVNGPAIGVGLDLICMCDIRIASENATFAESFVKVALVPGDGGAWLLPRVIGLSRASEMAFTGDAIGAQQALAWGLVSRVLPAASLGDEAMGLARRIAANPGSVLRMTKRLLREGGRVGLDALLELSASYQAIAHRSADHREAVQAFVEKRAPRFAAT
jgi:enoyl-CoA hydratase/carnithine racemase